MPNNRTQTTNTIAARSIKRLRAPALRDKGLWLIKKYGYWSTLGEWCVKRAVVGAFDFMLASKFDGAAGFLELEPIYNVYRALNGRPLAIEPDYLLDVGHGRYKVASFEWKENGPVHWRTFKTGAWEAELLDLRPDSRGQASFPSFPIAPGKRQVH